MSLVHVLLHRPSCYPFPYSLYRLVDVLPPGSLLVVTPCVFLTSLFRKQFHKR